jgi:uncharacterized membrane protein YbhN (UPF0104 family)
VSRRLLITTVTSVALALALLVALVVAAQVDIARVLQLLAGVRPLPAVALLVLTGIYVLLGAEKWRLVETRLNGGAELPRRLCFAFTAIGMAAGQVLPAQIAVAATRSAGSHLVTGSGAVRGALATLFEQMVELVVVALCSLVSLACMWRGDLGWWTFGAAAAVPAALLLIGPASALAVGATRTLAGLRPHGSGRVARFCRRLADSGLLDAALVRRLYVLSALRLVLLWGMAIATTQAVGLDVSLLQLAAALPLVVLASAFAITPANIGVNEWTFAAAFVAFGVDFETAAQWALVNRVLVAVAVLTVGALGALLTQVGGKPAASAPAG